MIGSNIADKYQILEHIRENALIDVYVGRRIDDGGPVVIKIVKDAVARSCGGFASLQPHFDRAASLAHRDVSRLIDYGTTIEEVYYVEEYYDGMTMKSIMERARSISPVKALNQIIKAVEVLAFAHTQGIVHGMITPESIIIGGDLGVRMTDFCILPQLHRDVTRGLVSMPPDIRYCAPEVFEGGRPTAASDVYSIGMVLYELIAGKPAIDKHSRSRVPLPVREIKPEVPKFLESVIMNSIAQAAERRYPDGNALLEELHMCRSSLVRAIYESQGAAPQPHEPDENTTGVLRDASVRDNITERITFTPQPNAQSSRGDAGNNENYGAPAGNDAVIGEMNMPNDGPPQGKNKPRKKMPPALTAFLIALGVLIVIMAFGIKIVIDLLGLNSGTATVIVPSVKGKSVVEAKSLLGSYKLEPEITAEQFSSDMPEGYVIMQNPPESTRVKTGRKIELIISRGQETVDVPNVTGIKADDARVIIAKAGFKLGDVSEEYNDSVENGYVISQNPAPDEKHAAGYVISIIVSKGVPKRMVVMPRLIDLPLNEARNLLEMNNINRINVKQLPTGAQDRGYVAAQSVLENTEIDPSREVTIYEAVPPGSGNNSLVEGVIKHKVQSRRHAQEVVIMVYDNNGAREVYRQSHQPGEIIEVKVESYGKTSIKVYLDGILAKEQTN